MCRVSSKDAKSCGDDLLGSYSVSIQSILCLGQGGLSLAVWSRDGETCAALLLLLSLRARKGS